MSTTNPICARVKSRLPEYVSGALTRSEKREIDSHLTECSDCRKLFAEIGAVVHDDHVPSHNHSRRPTPKIRSHERLHPVMLLNSSRHVVAGVLVAFLVMLTAVITIIRSGIDSPNEKQQGYIDAITKANEARLDERSPRQPPPARLRAQPAAQPPPQQPIGAAQPSASPPALAHNQSSSPSPPPPSQSAASNYPTATGGQAGNPLYASPTVQPQAQRQSVLMNIADATEKRSLRDTPFQTASPHQASGAASAPATQTSQYALPPTTRRAAPAMVLPSPSSNDRIRVKDSEFFNAFDYRYRPHGNSGELGIQMEYAPSPFNPGLHLLRIAVISPGQQGEKVDPETTYICIPPMSDLQGINRAHWLIERMLRGMTETTRITMVSCGHQFQKIAENVPSTQERMLRTALKSRPVRDVDWSGAMHEAFTSKSPSDKLRRVIMMINADDRSTMMTPDRWPKPLSDIEVLAIPIGENPAANPVAARAAALYGAKVFPVSSGSSPSSQDVARAVESRGRVTGANLMMTVTFNKQIVARARLVTRDAKWIAANHNVQMAPELSEGKSLTYLYEVELKRALGSGERLADFKVLYDHGGVRGKEAFRSCTTEFARAELSKGSAGFQLAAMAGEALRRLPASQTFTRGDLRTLSDAFSNELPRRVRVEDILQTVQRARQH